MYDRCVRPWGVSVSGREQEIWFGLLIWGILWTLDGPSFDNTRKEETYRLPSACTLNSAMGDPLVCIRNGIKAGKNLSTTMPARSSRTHPAPSVKCIGTFPTFLPQRFCASLVFSFSIALKGDYPSRRLTTSTSLFCRRYLQEF